jgi:putative ABC transport system permease protein
MFFTYLRRELRRRARQAVLIGLGLALGIGLVIMVSAASAGVKNAQGQVLHSLYGVGTDMTVTQAAAAGTGRPPGFGFGGSGQPKAGTKFSSNRLVSGSLGPLSEAAVTSVSKLHGIAAAAGALTLSDISISGTIPSSSGGGFGGGGSGTGRGFVTPKTFSVVGVDLASGATGPLSSGKITAGRTFSASDASSDVAVVDSNYATQNKLKVGSTVPVGSSTGNSARFTVIGIVSSPAGTSTDVFIPLARAQVLAGMTGKVNTIYVAASSATAISSVQHEISKAMPKATVTTATSLASEVTGSLASAASLAANLGKWLAIAVLAAAFALAALLSMSAVSRRVREFGTLKALGWRSRRIVGQVMGEAVAIGIVGGIAGVALGFAGSALIGKLAPALTASVGQSTGTATPGGARIFSGGPPGGGAGGFGGGFRNSAASTVTVHLSAPVTASVIVAAVLLAVAGGIFAGGLGSWRAARLRPADALSKIA